MVVLRDNKHLDGGGVEVDRHTQRVKSLRKTTWMAVSWRCTGSMGVPKGMPSTRRVCEVRGKEHLDGGVVEVDEQQHSYNEGL